MIEITKEKAFQIAKAITRCHCIEHMYSKDKDVALKEEMIIEIALTTSYDHPCKAPLDNCTKSYRRNKDFLAIIETYWIDKG